MSLRQLAAFPIIPDPTIQSGSSPPAGAVGIGNLTGVYAAAWYQDAGFVVQFYSDVGLPLIKRVGLAVDGVYQLISPAIAATTVQGGMWGWWTTARKMLSFDLASPPTGQEWLLEPKMLTASLVQPDYVNGLGQRGGTYVRTPTNRLLFDGHNLHVMDGALGAIEGPTFPFYSGNVWAGRNEHDVFVYEVGFPTTLGDTQCCFYDTTLKQLSSPIMHLGMGSMCVQYAPEFGVIVSIHSMASPPTGNGPYELRIWALEPVPVEVKPPTIWMGAPEAGLTTVYRTQVLGSYGEPCPNELIDWSIAGVGQLLTVQSTTDEDGYATVKVRYGLHDSDLTVIRASLKC